MKKRVTYLLLVVASLAMTLVTLPAHAAPTQLQPNVTHSSGQLRIQGILVSQGKAVAGGALTASIDGAAVANATTDAAGGYDFTADISQLSDGSHELQIAFAGLGEAEAAQWSATVSVTGSQASTQSTQQTGGQATALTLSGPAEARSGDVIELKGTVTGANGAAIANAGVSIFDATGEVANSFTITAANGSFSTLYLIPEEQGDGPLEITAEFSGGNGLSAAKATHTINVSKAEVIDPSATPSSEAATAPSLDTTASATAAAPSPSATASQTVATPPQSASILPWVLLGLAAVGSIGLTVAAGLILRRRNQASREAVTSSLVLIDDAADEGAEPEIAEDTPQVAEPSQPPATEPVQPDATPIISTPVAQKPEAAPAPAPHRAATDLPPAPRRSDVPTHAESTPARGLPADTATEAEPLEEWSDWAEEPPTTPRRGL